MNKSNEPAFPVPAYRDSHDWHNEPLYGLTKREEFAKAAMQGLCARGNIAGSPKERADVAIEIADALLAELAKEVK